MKYLINLGAMLFCALLVSCVEKADLRTGEKTVVVDCILTNDSIQTVKLCYSSQTGDNYYPPVKDAQVSVSFSVDTIFVADMKRWDIDTTITYSFSKVGEGVWQAKFTPYASFIYNLQVLVPGKDTITASTKVPSKVGKGGWHLPFDGSINRIISKEFTFDSPPGISWVYGEDYNPATDTYEMVEYIYSSYIYLDKFNATTLQKKNVTEFIMSKGMKPYPHNGYMTAPGRYKDGYSKDSVAVPLHLGIKNGEDDSEDNVMLKRYLRIDNRNAGTIESLKSDFTIVANFKPQFYNAAHPKARVVFNNVSEEYDKYLRDVFTREMKSLDPSDDLTDVWEKDEGYSNIINGKGIFGYNYKSVVPYTTYARKGWNK